MRLPDALAIAVDLGTTTIAASLLDISSGERLAAAGSLNPQREFGADVVSRLDAACRSPEALRKMADLVREELHRLAAELFAVAGLDIGDLKRIAIAGNPAMEHLLLGLSVTSLAFPPYRPLFTAGKTVSISELGWDGDAEAYLFPLPGGFVGGDTVAFLYGTVDDAACSTQHAVRLYLDLGTNGEIALSAGGKLYATSAAAGPAFEGGNLSCGMAALPGAVSGVSMEGARLVVATIGGKPARGICGSGVMDTLSLLLEQGVVDGTGRLMPPGEISSNLANHVREVGGEPAFVIYRDAARTVCLTQEDIRQVQLAKGAIRAGMEVLFARAGIGCEAVEEVILTGSFGAVLSPRSLNNVGILTEKMVEVTRFVREGALAGVEKALATPQGLRDVDGLAEMIRVIPLSGTPAFEKNFLQHINFP